MKTLIIHPQDLSTFFLTYVYAKLDDNYTIETEPLSTSKFSKLCKEHDRIICMGHGDTTGLFGVGRQEINSKRVDSLRGKDLICLWCNSMGFASKYKLKGIFCDMIVSEMEEAVNYCVPATQDHIDKSNIELAMSLRLALALDPDKVYESWKERYQLPVGFTNPVVTFNHANIHKVI